MSSSLVSGLCCGFAVLFAASAMPGAQEPRGKKPEEAAADDAPGSVPASSDATPAPADPAPPATQGGAPAPPPVEPLTLRSARQMRIEGKHAEALAAYETLARDADPPVQLEAGIGIARTLAETGKYREALGRLEALASLGERSASWHCATAELLHALGQCEAALLRARKGIEVEPTHVASRLLTAQLLEYL